MRKLDFYSKTFLLLVGLLLLTVGSIDAQLAVTRSHFTAPYVSIAGAPGANLSTAAGDNGLQTTIPIGFLFNYLGVGQINVDVSTNGAMAFSGSGLLATSVTNQNLYLTTGPNGIIAPWWDDLNVDASASIWTQLSGAPGSQVFTVEWNNVLSYGTGSTQRLNFQVKLFETSNNIEFHYGALVAGTPSTLESATIGIENSTGGLGNYLDIVTGSSNIGNYFLQAATGWPNRFYRLTPGLPAPLAPGVYTAGSAGIYPNLSEAVADVNHRGVAGPIVISLTDAFYNINPSGGDNWFPIAFGSVNGTSAANTILVQPASGTSIIAYDGSTAGGLANATTATAATTATEPIFALIGTDYVGVTNLSFVCAATAVVDRGIAVLNNSATNGAQFNAFSNISISMTRTLTSVIGIEQRLPTAPTAATGANSNNVYLNLDISNVYSGIYLLGNATWPDLACQVGTTGPTIFNSIGGATANDIGGQATQAYGIRINNLSGASLFNNNVQNVGGTGLVDGILVELAIGTTNVYNNNVRNIRNLSTTGVSNTIGIRANVATTASNNLRVFNNSVCNVISAYTGALSATRQIKGIFVQAAGGGVTTSSISVDHNTVYLDGTSSPNISSNCFESGGTATGPVINVRSNIFVNATGPQTTPAVHLGWRSTIVNAIGPAGSVSNFNDIWIVDMTQGFTGQGATTNYATLANWQAGVTQDANSVAGDPGFVNTSICDLHATSTVTNDVGTPIPWVTTDIDNQARSGTNPDMGFDEYNVLALDMGAVALVTPIVGACRTASEQVTIRIRNWAGNTIDFSVNNVTVTVNVTGAITTTINATLTSGTLAPGAVQDVIVGNINMTTAGTYTFNANTTMAGDGNTGNDAMLPVNRVFLAGTAIASPGNVCAGDSATLTVSGHNGSTVQWQVSTNNGASWAPIVGGTTNPFRVLAADTSWYRAEICGLIFSVFDTINVIPTTPPTTVGDTICGTGVASLSASGPGTLTWYNQPTGGTLLNTGPTYTPTVSTTTTYYVASGSGSTAGLHTTTYAAGNGSAGNAFTVKALTNITITGFDGHTNSTAINTWEIWYRPNDYLLAPGSHLSTVGWTLLGTASGVVGQNTGNITPIPIALNVQIPAGQTHSFQIFTLGGGVAYSNGTVLGALFNGNTDLEVYQGHGGTAWAGMTNQPRVFNGRIHYSSGCPSTRTSVTATVNPSLPVAISPTNGVSCSGDSVALTASSANTSYSYTWSPGATLNTTTGSSVLAGPSGTTAYSVIGIDTAGCEARDTVTVRYAAKPVPTAMISPDTICAGANIALTSSMPPTSFQVGTGTITNTNTSYPSPYGNWYWGSRHQMLILASELTALGVTAGNLSSLAFNSTNLNLAVAHQNFEIKLALTGVTAITTFQAPVFTSVFFSPGYMPALGVVPHVFSTPFYWDGVSNILVETCHQNSAYDENVSVAQSTTPFSSTVYYREDAAGVCANNSVTASIAQRPNMYFTMQANYGYAWTPSANLATPNAANTVGTASASTNFILMVTDSSTGCVGNDTVALFVRTSPTDPMTGGGTTCGTSTTLDAGNPGSTYAWSTGASTQTILVTTPGNYSVTVTAPTGCFRVDSTVVGFATASVVNLGPDTAVCPGTPLILDAGNPGASYLWSTADTSQTVSVTSAGTYYVDVTNTFGCTSTDTVVITLGVIPSVNLGADTAACQGSSITLDAGNAGSSFLWSNSATTQTIGVTTSGTYSVNVTNASGCVGSDTVVVTIYPLPTVNYTSNVDTLCSTAASVTLSGGSPAGGTYSGPGVTAGVFNPSTAGVGSHTVSYSFTDANGCTNSATQVIVVEICIGISGNLGATQIGLYPNPNDGRFKFTIPLDAASEVSYSISDARGAVIWQGQSAQPSGLFEQEVNISDFSTGVYTISVRVNGATAQKRFVVQR